MAVEREQSTRNLRLNLEGLVTRQASIFKSIIVRERNRKEADYYNKVLDLGLQTQDQIDYFAYNNQILFYFFPAQLYF